jgi:hypothetical protein
MKKSKILSLAGAVLLVFTSCSNDENGTLSNSENAKLLETFELKRDAFGAYSIDGIANSAQIDKTLDVTTNKKQLNLYPSDNDNLTKFTEELAIESSEFKVVIKDMNTNKFVNIAVYDDNAYLVKKTTEIKLSNYDVSRNEDGLYKLDFEVKNNTDVSFVYNEDDNAYEVHLEEGNGQVQNFSRVLELVEGQKLKLNFINHLSNQNAKSGDDDPKPVIIRKPVIIIDEGENG